MYPGVARAGVPDLGVRSDRGTAEKFKIFDPPTTHLTANIVDITGLLEGATDEADDLEEEFGNSAISRSPTEVHLRPWQVTSTQACFMVDSNRASQGSSSGKGDDPDYVPGHENPTHEGEGEPRSPSEFGDADLQALDEELGSPHHDQARENVIKSAIKLARDQNWIAGRDQELDDRWPQVLAYESLKTKAIPMATKQALALKGQRMQRNMEEALDPSAVSRRTWAKNLCATAGDQPPHQGGGQADANKGARNTHARTKNHVVTGHDMASSATRDTSKSSSRTIYQTKSNAPRGPRHYETSVE